MEPIQEAVRARYAGLAIKMAEGADAGCCDSGCCGTGTGTGTADRALNGDEYPEQQVRDLGVSLGVSLGCGNPVALAMLHPDQVVLDLGSGAGLDVLLSARRVSPGGHAYGVDMTDEMLALANEHKAKAGVENATFLKGTIEAVPLPDATVDVVISNCVINLAADKGAVIREAFRVLKPGGLMAVSDMVELEPLPDSVKSELDAWAGCIAGTIPVDAYRAAVAAAGFANVEIEITHPYTPAEVGLADGPGKIGSAFIRAVKPA
ncbi:MAG: arsenite methyltransferase [Candidatus Dormibacteraeota bacterium]|nr:arsenite methyltransferase [Candidatus Dormibacteraeota bacterium]